MLTIKVAKGKKREDFILKIECPHCFSTEHKSNGPNWLCKRCHTKFAKIKRMKIIPADKRTVCPDCGTSKPYAVGRNSFKEQLYICRGCGHHYKDSAGSNVKSSMEVEVE